MIISFTERSSKPKQRITIHPEIKNFAVQQGLLSRTRRITVSDLCDLHECQMEIGASASFFLFREMSRTCRKYSALMNTTALIKGIEMLPLTKEGQQKAFATILRSFVTSQPFVDGNHRMARNLQFILSHRNNIPGLLQEDIHI